MGAFFLYNHCIQDTDLQAVATIFSKKGFASPDVFELGQLTLWLYRKQLVADANFILLEDGSALFATGTVVYKSLSYRETLRALLVDFCRDQLDLNALLGNFCLIFYAKGKITLLTDRLCTHHVFVDDALNHISTSFLAMVVASRVPHRLNQQACYEKFFTGYNVGPDTLVEDIFQLTPLSQDALGNDRIHFLSQGIPNKNIDFERNGLQTCVQKQIESLLSYFDQIRALAGDYGCDLGLSSGYDSRLVLLLARKAGLSLSAHTHRTGISHENEYQHVQEIVERTNLELRVVRTNKMENNPEDKINAVLNDGLYYFDGRNSHNMGAFSETYTRQYKIATLANNRLSLNGLGGEIFRNYYYTSLPRFNFRTWIQTHVNYLFSWHALPEKDIWESLNNWMMQKMSKRLAVDLSGEVDLLTMRRYYSDIRMPDCDANNHNAHNQLAFYLTPFIEYKNVQNGYRATPYIGLTGEFEGALIKYLDADIAQVGSHYGFPLGREPLKHKLYGLLKGTLPDWFWLKRSHYRIDYQNLGEQNLQSYLDLYQHSPIIQQIEETLRTYFPAVNWRMLMRADDSKSTALYVGYFLLEFSSFLTKS